MPKAHVQQEQDPGTALVQLDAARQKLATVTSLPDLKQIRDQAVALEHYTKQRQVGLEVQNEAAAIRLEAERRIGAILREMKLRGGDRKSKGHDAPLMLRDLGISRDNSKRWQREAALPEERFQAYVTETRARGEELTAAEVLRQAKPFLPPSAPRPHTWEIGDDIDAIYALFNKLYDHWTTPEYRSMVRSTVRTILTTLAEPAPQDREGAPDAHG